jgi:hypothetical protein
MLMTLGVFGRASATAGSFTDGCDTTNSPLDMNVLTHNDDSSSVIYQAQMCNAFNDSDVDEVAWTLDVNNDGNGDLCVDAFFDGTLKAAVLSGSCSGGSASKLGDASASHPSPNVLQVTAAKSLLSGLGTSYGYSVESVKFSGSSIATDRAPNDGRPTIQHTNVGGGGTPQPTFTIPPTAQPTFGPTAVPGNNTSSRATCSDTTVVRGQRITCSGGGFAPARTISATFFSDPVALGTTTSDSLGNFGVTITIPATATVGVHTIQFVGPNNIGGTHTASADVTVVAKALPKTGGSIKSNVVRAFVVLTMGEMLLGLELFARRRRRARASA